MITKQSTNTIFMVKPVNFCFNEETKDNNSFQKKQNSINIQEKALEETNAFIKKLEENGINVVSVNDTLSPFTPDSIFPNNWFSTHIDGSIVLYPMYAENRRCERKIEFINAITKKFKVKRNIDLSRFEKENKFLEGTGSMVLDRINKIAYASLSIRTNLDVLDEFCKETNYKKIVFSSYDEKDKLIYHTNVMLSIGTEYAICCFDSIKDSKEKEMVRASLIKANKTIIEITYNQLNNFCANVLELKNNKDETFIVMSSKAYESFDYNQIKKLEKYGKIIHSDLSTIEINGGGSARCMMAEIF